MSRESLVVPAISLTKHLSSLSIALTKLLLPTLGLPIIEKFNAESFSGVVYGLKSSVIKSNNLSEESWIFYA